MIDNRNTIIVIPARMASGGFPGKPLTDLGGMPLISHVWQRAVEANVGPVLVAAAETEIASAVVAQGGDAIVTTPSLPSGADRIAEALRLRDPSGDFRFVLSLPASLPFIEPLSIQRCLAGLVNESADMSTIALEISDPRALQDTAVVKVVTPLTDTREVAFARDFTRHVAGDVPPPHWRHVAAFAFKRDALDLFAALPVSARESERRLSAMRALDNGLRIAVVRVDSDPLEVNTADDLARARAFLRTAK